MIVERLKLKNYRNYSNLDIKDSNSDLVYMIFTSGSTGDPKGVPISKSNLSNFIDWISSLKPLDTYKDICVLNQASFSFDLSVADFYYSMCNGHTLIALEGDVQDNFDEILDVSIVSLVWPFEVLGPLNEKVIKTVEKIEQRLKDNIGGIHRFEYDHYMNDNPWIIATLWLSMYYIKKYKKTFDINDQNKAREYFDFATNHRSMHGFLAEQISKETGYPLWVNGLAWSHAMYIICLEEFYG